MSLLSSSNISLVPGTTFLLKNNERVTRCNFSKKATKRTFLSQRFFLPTPTCVRLLPLYRRDCALLYKPARHIVSATETEVAVEEPNSPVVDNSSGGPSKSQADAVESTEQSSPGNNDTSASAQSKNIRPGRKSQMPAVKNEELIPGAMFTGKVRAIQPFGAFVDFGAFTDGLVHVSRLSDNFVKDVGSVVSVGQEVKVRIIEANLETGRISLSMREDGDDAGKPQQFKDIPAAKGDRPRPGQRGRLPKPKYVVGEYVDGIVKEKTPTGCVITLPDGEQEGFISVFEEPGSELRPEAEKSLLSVGDTVTARVMRISRGQVSLTLKEEDNDGDGDGGVFRGEVPATANPFACAFRQNKEISTFLNEMEKAVTSASSAVDEAVNIEPSLLQKIGGAIETIKENAEEISGVLGNPVSTAVETIKEDTERISGVLEKTVSAEVNASSSDEVPSLGQKMDGAIKAVKEDIEEASGVAEKTVSAAIETVKEDIEEASGVLEKTVPAEIETVKDDIEEVSRVRVLDKTVSAAIETVKEDIEEVSGVLDDTVSAEIENVKDIKEASGVLDDTVSAAIETVKEDIEEVSGVLEKTVSADIETVKEDIEEASGVLDKTLSAAIETVKEDIEEVSGILEKTVSAAVDASSSAETPILSDLVASQDITSRNPISEEVVAISQDDALTEQEQQPEASSAETEVPVSASAENELDQPTPDENGNVAAAEASISPTLVKQLREETGAGMMNCKKALAESGGDIVKAQEFLRKKGLASAEKKASRVTAEGRIGSYIHDSRIGVLIEVNCETDFVSRGEIFKELVDDLAMQVAACPQVQYLVPEDVPEEIVSKETEIEMLREDLASKPEQFRSKIVEGRIRKRLEEVALLEQPFIKNDKVPVKDWVKQTIATIGENIKVKRFVRFNLGEGLEKKSQDFAAEVAAQTAAKKTAAPEAEKPDVSVAKESAPEPPAVAISAALVKQLREESGAGMMDCKKALAESGGDLEKAQEYLRKKGLSTADKKSSRLAAEGRIGSYIHDSRIGVLIEVNCETDFVGRSANFKELVDDLAMQIVASPQVQYVSVEEVPESTINKEKELERQREDLQSKPENMRERIVEGRVSKRLGELALLEQPFIKDDKLLVKDLVKQTVAALGENIKVRRFVRFTLGESS